MNVLETSPPSSFMKAARAHYRLPGGKALGTAMALLFAALIALILKADMFLFGVVSPQRTVTLVLIILVAMLALMVFAVQDRARKLWARAHDGVIGNRLQTRIILMFTAIAIVPTLIVAAFSILFFNVGVKSWFDTQVAEALEDSVAVATAYVEEHKESIRNAAASLGDVVHAEGAAALSNATSYSQFLTRQSAQRNLSEAVVFNRDAVLARTSLSFSLTFERMNEAVLARADDGQIAVFSSEEDNKIQAVVKISNAPSVYLLVTRVVDPKVLQHMQSALKTVDDYHRLEDDLAKLQKQFFVVFILIALIIVMTSLWAGILLAVRLIEPLRALMMATEQVRGGDYSIRVPEGRPDDEIANLGRTFNRMTGQLESQRRDLMAAERRAAWADVARRIAHEIKNPLTPITLSAERLRKKFRQFVPPEEQESYEKYLETIARHTRDIGRMVEEFVAYARMPQSVFREENLVAIVRKAVFSEQTAHPEIQYLQDLPAEEIRLNCDESQLGRALLNLLKNAAEAMEGSTTKHIRITLEREGDRILLTLEDTGPGFPPEKLDTLTEPYVTTRAKGTGLGLAIVKRSIEEHKGTLTLTNRDGGGARVVVALPG